MNSNLNKNQIIIIFLLLVLFMLYYKKKEQFKDFTKNYNNYNGLVNYNFSPYVYKEKTINELHLIITKILNQINIQTNSNLVLAKSVNNYDNIVIEKITNNKNRYLIDVFVNDIKKYYTLRLIINFEYDKKKKKIKILTITRGNAIKLNDNNILDYDTKVNCNKDSIILPVNNINLEYSELKNKINKELPIPPDYQKEILPLYIHDMVR